MSKLEERMKETTIIAVLTAITLLLTNIFFPDKFVGVGLLLIAPISFMEGWCLGLMEATKT